MTGCAHHWTPHREGKWGGEPSFVMACTDCSAILRNGVIFTTSTTTVQEPARG